MLSIQGIYSHVCEGSSIIQPKLRPSSRNPLGCWVVIFNHHQSGVAV